MSHPELSDRQQAVHDMLVRVVENEPAARVIRTRRRTMYGAAAVLSVASVAAVAATAVMESRPVADYSIVHCLSSLQLGPNGDLSESAVVMDPAIVGEATPDDAISICESMWIQGVLEPDHDPLAVPATQLPVPPSLSVCVMADGSAAVIPGEPEDCTVLGLATLGSG